MPTVWTPSLIGTEPETRLFTMLAARLARAPCAARHCLTVAAVQKRLVQIPRDYGAVLDGTVVRDDDFKANLASMDELREELKAVTAEIREGGGEAVGRYGNRLL